MPCFGVRDDDGGGPGTGTGSEVRTADETRDEAAPAPLSPRSGAGAVVVTGRCAPVGGDR
ncbi:hypothetical protein GCM10023191_035100 [Actinoallomurus oryzae]|uniref:Uncharacterized protein n=1 Tax=Actinoallomurus oryzae TaxID=502180 RepID=A0ABP8Q048_9ACTN